MRIKKLRALQILHTESEPGFDNLAQLAGAIACTPFAAISLIARDEQWCKALHGWKLNSIPRDKSPCALVVEHGSPIIVEDVKVDERLSARFPICPEIEIRFYAGFPIIIEDQAVGTLCVANTEPQQLTMEQIASLVMLANQVGHQLVIREQVAALETENRGRTRLRARIAHRHPAADRGRHPARPGYPVRAVRRAAATPMPAQVSGIRSWSPETLSRGDAPGHFVPARRTI